MIEQSDKRGKPDASPMLLKRVKYQPRHVEELQPNPEKNARYFSENLQQIDLAPINLRNLSLFDLRTGKRFDTCRAILLSTLALPDTESFAALARTPEQKKQLLAVLQWYERKVKSNDLVQKEEASLTAIQAVLTQLTNRNDLPVGFNRSENEVLRIVTKIMVDTQYGPPIDRSVVENAVRELSFLAEVKSTYRKEKQQLATFLDLALFILRDVTSLEKSELVLEGEKYTLVQLSDALQFKQGAFNLPTSLQEVLLSWSGEVLDYFKGVDLNGQPIKNSSATRSFQDTRVRYLEEVSSKLDYNEELSKLQEPVDVTDSTGGIRETFSRALRIGDGFLACRKVLDSPGFVKEVAERNNLYFRTLEALKNVTPIALQERISNLESSFLKSIRTQILNRQDKISPTVIWQSFAQLRSYYNDLVADEYFLDSFENKKLQNQLLTFFEKSITPWMANLIPTLNEDDVAETLQLLEFNIGLFSIPQSKKNELFGKVLTEVAKYAQVVQLFRPEFYAAVAPFLPSPEPNPETDTPDFRKKRGLLRYAQARQLFRTSGLEQFLQVLQGSNAAALVARTRYQTSETIAERFNPETQRRETKNVSHTTLRNYNRLDDWELQRRQQEGPAAQLSSQEVEYIQSVEAVSGLAPHLTAAARADRDVMRLVLQRHFEKQQARAMEFLFSREHIPMLCVGLGPNQTAFLDKFALLNPDFVAKDVLCIEEAMTVGGSFAIPGRAIQLNSGAGNGSATLAPSRPADVLTYSSRGAPWRDIVGQRQRGSSTQRSDINQIAGSFPGFQESDLSNGKYGYNDTIWLAMAGQLALTAPNLGFGMELATVTPAPTPEYPFRKKVTLVLTAADGRSKVITRTVDYLVIGSGKSEPNLGFELKNFATSEVIEESTGQSEPIKKYNEYVPFLEGLTSKYEKDPGRGLGKRICIYGKGDSARTVVEALGGLLELDDPIAIERIRSLEKIYVIAPNGPKTFDEFLKMVRPRYARGADLIDRGLEPELRRLVTFIDAKVDGFAFIPEENKGPTEQRRMNVSIVETNRDSSKKRSTYAKDPDTGLLLKFDNIVNCSGFTSSIGGAFSQYSNEEVPSVESLTEGYYLPGSTKLRVAQMLSGDPNTIFIGTAGDVQLTPEEIAQFPLATQAALKKVGQNYVALAIRALLAEVAAEVAAERWGLKATEIQETRIPREFKSVFASASPRESLSFVLPTTVPAPRLFRSYDRELAAKTFIATELAGVRFCTAAGSTFSGELNCSISLVDGLLQVINLKKKSDSGRQTAMPEEYAEVITAALSDNYTQAVIREMLQIGNYRGATAELKFQVARGRVDAETIRLQTAVRSRK